MSSGIVWQRRPTQIADDIAVYARRVEAATVRAGERLAAILEADARRDAPWTNRTGVARRELHAAASIAGDLVTIYLAHGPSVDYGRYLELAHAERYAVIWPTISRHLATIWRLIAEELS